MFGGKKDVRYFKVIGSGIGFEGGRYKGDTPEQAGRKAGRSLWRKVETESKYKQFDKGIVIKFILAETTQGSNKKTYSYKVEKKKKPVPKTVTLNGATFVSNFSYVVHACHDIAH